MKISMVRNAKATETYPFAPETLVRHIRDGHWKEPMAAVQQAFQRGGKATAREFKERLPAIMWSGAFNRRANDALQQHSGLLCADIDDLGERLPTIRQAMLHDPHIFTLFLSPTGSGLKAVFRVKPEKATHRSSFDAVAKHCQEKYGIAIDPSGKDVARLCFVSVDPNLHFNPSAVELLPLPENPAPPELMKRIIEGDEAKIREAISFIPAGDYDTWIRIGMALRRWDEARGLALWDEWSRGCPEKYDPQRTADKWSSFNATAPGGITLGTVYELARQNGWRPTPARIETARPRLALASGLEWRPMPEVLPDPFATLVREGSNAIGTDPAAIALPLLATAASVIGNTRRISLKSNWQEPSVIWAVPLMASGERKSPAMELATRPLQDLQNIQFGKFKTAMDAWKTNLRSAKRDGLEPPPEPMCTRYIFKDVSLAVLALLLAENPRGLLLARDELSAWLGGMERFDQDEGASHWLEMHGARSIIVDRKTGDPRTLNVPRAAVSITGTMQLPTFVRLLEQKNVDNGLAARFLLAMPPRTRREWSESTVAAETQEAVKRIYYELLALQFGARNTPIDLPLSPEAKFDLWIPFYNSHAGEMHDLTHGPLLAAFSKLEGYAARLALVLDCVRAVSTGSTENHTTVSAASVEAGIALAEWFKHETRRVYCAMAEDADHRDARAVLELAKVKGTPLALRDVMREGPCFETSERAMAVVSMLVEAGEIRWISEPGKQGKTKERFVLADAVRAEAA